MGLTSIDGRHGRSWHQAAKVRLIEVKRVKLVKGRRQRQALGKRLGGRRRGRPQVAGMLGVCVLGVAVGAAGLHAGEERVQVKHGVERRRQRPRRVTAAGAKVGARAVE